MVNSGRRKKEKSKLPHVSQINVNFHFLLVALRSFNDDGWERLKTDSLTSLCFPERSEKKIIRASHIEIILSLALLCVSIIP